MDKLYKSQLEMGGTHSEQRMQKRRGESIETSKTQFKINPKKEA